jgi:hypothetical protein
MIPLEKRDGTLLEDNAGMLKKINLREDEKWRR